MIFESQLARPSTVRTPLQPQTDRRLQRKCACGGTPGPTGECENCRKKRLQRKSNIGIKTQTASDVPPIVDEVLRSPGQPLDAATLGLMEPRFGHDFGHVRVHTNAEAAESARAVRALAYTVGNNVVFGENTYAPTIRAGRELLAHELAHTIQQGEVSRGTVLEISEPTDSAEREANAASRAVAAGRTFATSNDLQPRLARQQGGTGGGTAAPAAASGWYPKFPGCSPAQDRRLDFQITFARTRVEQTISALQDFLTEKPSRAGIITGTESGLLRHFGTSEPAYVKRIITGLGKILARLRKGSQNWRCADAIQCQKICGDVPFACASPTIPVTFCPPHFGEGDGYGTMILIHETGHQAGFAFHTYDPIAARTAMQPKDIAISSTDSFASLVDDLSLGGPRIPGAYSLREKVEGARQEVEEQRRRPAGGGR